MILEKQNATKIKFENGSELLLQSPSWYSNNIYLSFDSEQDLKTFINALDSACDVGVCEVYCSFGYYKAELPKTSPTGFGGHFIVIFNENLKALIDFPSVSEVSKLSIIAELLKNSTWKDSRGVMFSPLSVSFPSYI